MSGYPGAKLLAHEISVEGNQFRELFGRSGAKGLLGFPGAVSVQSFWFGQPGANGLLGFPGVHFAVEFGMFRG